MFGQIHRRWGKLFSLALISLALLGMSSNALAQTQRSPSDVVREFYKAMRERRFKDAWSLTIYKIAVESLTAEETEDLRPDFEAKALAIPEQIEITGEQITANTATVFVKVPAKDSTPQITSEPVTLIYSSGVWIIGDEANLAIVKKAGRRFFLDALIEEHHGDVEELMKRLVGVEAIFAAKNNGAFGDLKALIKAGLMSDDVADPKALGYDFRIAIGKDGKSYVATAEPTRYDHTGKLSFSMDQTGLIKKVDNAGKPVK